MTYCDKDTAKEAVKKLNRHEIKPNRRIIVKLSVQFNRLYIGGVPKSKSKDDIYNAFSKEVENLKCKSHSSSSRSSSIDFRTRRKGFHSCFQVAVTFP